MPQDPFASSFVDLGAEEKPIGHIDLGANRLPWYRVKWTQHLSCLVWVCHKSSQIWDGLESAIAMHSFYICLFECVPRGAWYSTTVDQLSRLVSINTDKIQNIPQCPCTFAGSKDFQPWHAGPIKSVATGLNTWLSPGKAGLDQSPIVAYIPVQTQQKGAAPAFCSGLLDRVPVSPENMFMSCNKDIILRLLRWLL